MTNAVGILDSAGFTGVRREEIEISFLFFSDPRSADFVTASRYGKISTTHFGFPKNHAHYQFRIFKISSHFLSSPASDAPARPRDGQGLRAGRCKVKVIYSTQTHISPHSNELLSFIWIWIFPGSASRLPARAPYWKPPLPTSTLWSTRRKSWSSRGSWRPPARIFSFQR